MDWRNDTNAAASRFYPSAGRRGKGMTGKASQIALLRSKHSKFAAKWTKLFEARYIKDYKLKHGKEPSQDEVKTESEAGLRVAIDSGSVYNDIERWTDTGCVLSIRHGPTCFCNICKKYPMTDMAQACASMAITVEAHKKAAEERKAGKLADEAAERAHRENSIKMTKIREKPSIPEAVMGRLLNNLVSQKEVLMCFPVDEVTLAEHKEAFKHLKGATDK
jgi:hypothetical protein